MFSVAVGKNPENQPECRPGASLSFFFCRVEKDLKKAEGSGRGIQGRTSVAKTRTSSSPNHQTPYVCSRVVLTTRAIAYAGSKSL